MNLETWILKVSQRPLNGHDRTVTERSGVPGFEGWSCLDLGNAAIQTCQHKHILGLYKHNQNHVVYISIYTIWFEIPQ